MLNRSASLAMSTSVLKALPGKLDIKRHSPSILYVSTKFQNTRYARAAVNRQGYFLRCCSILKESCSYCNYPEKNVSVSKLKLPYRLSTNYRNIAFGILEAGTRVTRVTDAPRIFGHDERTVYRLQTH